MNRAYVVDLENDSSFHFLNNIKLDCNDRVTIFYSNSRNNINIDALRVIYDSECELEFIKAYTGKPNSLDFQLVVYITSLMHTYDDGIDIYIVSNDKGYIVALNFLKEIYCGKNKLHFCSKALSEDSPTSLCFSAEENRFLKNLQETLDLSELDLFNIDLSTLHNKIRQSLGPIKYLNVYKEYKRLLAKKEVVGWQECMEQ